MDKAGWDGKEDEDEKGPQGERPRARPQLPSQALPDRPRTPPTGDGQREEGTGAGPAPGASEATLPTVPRRGTHPALLPQTSSEGDSQRPTPEGGSAILESQLLVG